LVAALVPVRSYCVHCLFTEADLKFLDPFAETLTNLPGVKKNKTAEVEPLTTANNNNDDNAVADAEEGTATKKLDHKTSTADMSVTEHANVNSSEEDANAHSSEEEA
jgi:hypothetical protein